MVYIQDPGSLQPETYAWNDWTMGKAIKTTQLFIIQRLGDLILF